MPATCSGYYTIIIVHCIITQPITEMRQDVLEEADHDKNANEMDLIQYAALLDLLSSCRLCSIF